MTVGERIKQKRKEKNITQKQLGIKLGGISQQQIGQWETGKANPKIETIKKIADALEVEWTDLADIENIEKEMDFFELYTAYLMRIGYNIKLFSKSNHLIYRIEYENEYVELTYDEFSTLSHDTLQHIISKLDELIQTKTATPIAAHNDQAEEPGELEKMQEDVEKLKRLED